MRVCIDLNEEQVGYLQRQIGKTRDGGTGFDIILGLAHQLPRPIEVGDKVVYASVVDNNDAAVWIVLAINDEHAWIRWVHGDEPLTMRLKDLVRSTNKPTTKEQQSNE